MSERLTGSHRLAVLTLDEVIDLDPVKERDDVWDSPSGTCPMNPLEPVLEDGCLLPIP